MVRLTGALFVVLAGGLGCAAAPARPMAGPGGCEADAAMVAVAAGSFRQGCDNEADRECPDSQLPVREMHVPAFDIDRDEVTVRRFAACVDAGACQPPADESFSAYCNWNAAGREDHPVNCVGWFQARAYCAWAGKRLCSESEWEKAARGTDGRTHPWGDDPPSCRFAVMWEDGQGCGTDATWPPGSRPQGASPYGVLDMSGNVWEWVEDDWHDDYRGAPADGGAWVDRPRAAKRVIRGGSFLFEEFLDVSYRSFADVSEDAFDIGIRCCRSR